MIWEFLTELAKIGRKSSALILSIAPDHFLQAWLVIGTLPALSIAIYFHQYRRRSRRYRFRQSTCGKPNRIGRFQLQPNSCFFFHPRELRDET